MKLVLLSDLHLDSQFSWMGISGSAAQKRRQNLREVLRRVLKLVQDEAADGLLCGGDLYEHERVTPDTADFLRSTFASIEPIPVFIAPGNHDWFGPSSVYQQTDWSPNVHIFKTNRPESVELTQGLLLWGAAHCAPAGTRDFLEGFRADGSAVHLALFHGSERGWLTQQGEGKEPHAPFSEGEIASAGLTHAFLGHYHRPLDGAHHTYPGNPDPLSFGEDGNRGVVIATIDAHGGILRERRLVAVTELDDLELDITGCGNQQAVRDQVAAQLEGRRRFVRLRLSGSVSPDVDLRLSDLGAAFPHLEGLQIRLGRIRALYDVETLAAEPTVRGAFVRDVRAATELSEEQRERILSIGLRALEGRSDLEAQ